VIAALVFAAVALVTSLGARALGRRGAALRARDLPRAAASVLEAVGFVVLFAAANFALAVLAEVAGRLAAGRGPLGSYGLVTAAWTLLSVTQGLVFHAWRAEARRGGREPEAARRLDTRYPPT
jgi:hypothetical protein